MNSIFSRMSDDIKQHTDLELYLLLQKKNKQVATAALEELYVRHSQKVFTYCRRIMGVQELAEDMFQEAFVRLYESAQLERNMTNVAGFLLRIARNLCLSYKHKNRRPTVSLEDMQLPDSIQGYETTELMQLVEMALETLAEDYRESFVMREFLGMPYTDIAEILDISLPLVKTRIYRAKNQIRVLLAPYIEDLQKN